LCALLLAWCLGEVERGFPPNLLQDGRIPSLSCNVGVPVDQLDIGSPLRTVFDQVVRHAWVLRSCVRQGVGVDLAVGWVRALERAHDPPTGVVAVCPETLAAVVSHMTSPNVKLGMYALVDIGAWTTDVSIFRLSDVSMLSEGIRTAAVYQARTHRVAAGLVDQLACELHLQLWRECEEPLVGNTEAVVGEITRRREQGLFSEAPLVISGKTRMGAPSALEHARIVVGEAIGRRFSRTYDEAVLKETDLSRHDWHRLNVLLLGGGSEEAVFTDRIRRHLDAGSLQLLPQTASLNWPVTPDRERLDRRLSVAAGLAIPYALWPKQFRPSEVDVPEAGATAAVREWDRDPYD
jgi:hypothetical protein